MNLLGKKIPQKDTQVNVTKRKIQINGNNVQSEPIVIK